MAFLAFVSLGLPDGVAGVAWPFVRRDFGLPLDRLGQLLAFGVAGYLVSSILAGKAVARWGVGKLLAGSTAVVAAALVGFAAAPGWGWMLPMGLAVGLGSGAIDASINTFAATSFSARAVTWLHACYGVGATIGPLVMAAVANAAGLGWRWGYGLLAAALGAMALAFSFTPGLWKTPAPAAGATPAPATPAAGIWETFRRPVVLAHVLIFFLYTGSEVTAGQWLFSLMIEQRGFDKATAGWVVGGFWAALTAGRVTFGQLATKLDRLTILRIGFGLAPAGAALMCWRDSQAATALSAALLGFALAPIYPVLVSATPGRVGERFAAHAVGFEVSAATVGIAVVPGIGGVLAQRVGLEAVPPFILTITLLLLVLHEATVRLL
ncbi:MAG TPA: MFS transporter, partial [Humisphaera sp.]